MSLVISSGVLLKQPTGASWTITPTYTPPFPSSPVDQQEWTDINTGITWVYNAGTAGWTQQP